MKEEDLQYGCGGDQCLWKETTQIVMSVVFPKLLMNSQYTCRLEIRKGFLQYCACNRDVSWARIYLRTAQFCPNNPNNMKVRLLGETLAKRVNTTQMN